jgi:hypothetical protein
MSQLNGNAQLFKIITEIVEAGLEVHLHKSDGLMCASFPTGFYQSDGDAYLTQKKELVVLYTRFGGQRAITDVESLAKESHLSWKLAKNLNAKWATPAQLWAPLYRRYGFIKDPVTVNTP